MRPRRIGVAPVLVPLAFLAMTLGLGVWQVERMHWKAGILDAIARAEAKGPVPLGAGPVALGAGPVPLGAGPVSLGAGPVSLGAGPVSLGAGPRPSQFERVVVSGRLDPSREAAYASDVRDVRGVPTFGVFLLEPLLRAHAPAVLVDLGWVPASTTGRPAVTVAGTRTVVGYVRRPEHPALFTPAPDLATRQFYALEPVAIGRAVGLGDGVAPFTVVALRQHGDPAFPAAETTLPRPPDNHLQYAVTWFTLAALTVVMTGAWWAQALGRRGTA